MQKQTLAALAAYRPILIAAMQVWASRHR